MPKAPPSFDFFYQDFRDGVRRLTREQIGAYVLLLIEQFEEGALPDNPSVLSGIISTAAENCTDEHFKSVWSAIQGKFTKYPGGLRNQKMAEIRQKTFKRWNANRENGKKGGRPKKPKQNPSVSGEETQTKPNGKVEGGRGKVEGSKKENTVPPKLAEVETYCKQRQAEDPSRRAVDANEFCDYYETRGWKLKGGVVMKSWQAAVRTWEKRDGFQGNGKPEQRKILGLTPRETT